MNPWEHDDAIRNMLRRGTLVDTNDDGEQQTMTFRGMAGEELKKVVRVQPYGFTSHPPAGSEGLIASLGGRSDRAMLLGVEHPKYRQKSLGPGSVALYDQHGNIVSTVEANMRIKHSTEIVIECGSSKIVLKPGEITITGSAIKFEQG